MKRNFIDNFIYMIKDMGGEIYYNWKSTSISYKGLRVSGYSKEKIYKGFKNLQSRGILDETSQGKYRFTRKGQIWFKRSLLNFHRINKTKWDAKWRVVIFDIPQELHNKRNLFRNKLRLMGFYMIQKSIFVFPYPCEEELSECCKKIRVGDYVDVMIVERLGAKQNEIKKHFNLKTN